MRHSELALVVVRLKIGTEPYHLLIRHRKWGDWSFIGGHLEPDEKNEWARAAVRECNEELRPLKFGDDFTLLPLLDQPLRWGPQASRSASNEPTIYTAQLFALRFLRPPADCLAMLSADEFRIVAESDLVGTRQDDDMLTARMLHRVSPVALAWDGALPPLMLKAQRLHA